MEPKEKVKLILCFVSLLICHEASGVSDFCFGCKDTSDAEGKDNCQEKYKRSMNDLHAKYIYEYRSNSTEFLHDNQHNTLIQDCREYHKFGMNKCCIEMLEKFGTVYSYIRTCCDGVRFSVNTTEVPRLRFLSSNNQTLCAYDDYLGYVVCVSMCEGNFCNGPSSAASVRVSLTLLILCFVLTVIKKWSVGL